MEKVIKYTKLSGKQDNEYHVFVTIRSWEAKVILLVKY